MAAFRRWLQQGETPTVAPRLKIEPLARDLQHPRSIYVLPNGDILVGESKSPNAQPIQRPKDGGVESWVTLGGKAGESNRITLLRDEDGDGKPEARSVFLDHLASPFGVTLVVSDLYVASRPRATTGRPTELGTRCPPDDPQKEAPACGPGL